MKFKVDRKQEADIAGKVLKISGLVSHDPQRRIGARYAAPLYWFLRSVREMRYRLSLVLTAPTRERAEAIEVARACREREKLEDEYARGYSAGWVECLKECLQAVEDELSRSGGPWDVGSLFAGDNPPRPQN